MRDWTEASERSSIGTRIEFIILMSLYFLSLGGIVYGLVPTRADAHPGGLAANGCRNDRKNGGRHCHRGSSAGQSVALARLGGTYFPNCDAARRAGAAPVRRGDPGYGSHLDRDRDGIGCE